MRWLTPDDAPMMLEAWNTPSVGLLEKPGLQDERPVRLPGEDPDVSLYRIGFAG